MKERELPLIVYGYIHILFSKINTIFKHMIIFVEKRTRKGTRCFNLTCKFFLWKKKKPHPEDNGQL